MHFLSEITEEENINEVEREYAFEIVINQKKVQFLKECERVGGVFLFI